MNADGPVFHKDRVEKVVRRYLNGRFDGKDASAYPEDMRDLCGRLFEVLDEENIDPNSAYKTIIQANASRRRSAEETSIVPLNCSMICGNQLRFDPKTDSSTNVVYCNEHFNIIVTIFAILWPNRLN
ncbi:hypothetical protein ACOME3_001098 [Neoechinorhynchus agilis]